MTKLNPCPDCGREPDLEERGKAFRVACWHCISAEFITARTAGGAMNAWNAATSEQPVKTLRDEFAMAALLMFASEAQRGANYFGEDAAAHAYFVADAMIKERNK